MKFVFFVCRMRLNRLKAFFLMANSSDLILFGQDTILRFAEIFSEIFGPIHPLNVSIRSPHPPSPDSYTRWQVPLIF